MQRELVFELSELKRIRIVCPKCGSELLIPADGQTVLLDRCGVCPEKWQDDFTEGLRAFRNSLGILRGLGSFKVRIVLVESERKETSESMEKKE